MPCKDVIPKAVKLIVSQVLRKIYSTFVTLVTTRIATTRPLVGVQYLVNPVGTVEEENTAAQPEPPAAGE